MPKFNPRDYGAAVAALLDKAEPAPLDAGTPAASARAVLAGLTVEKLFAGAGNPVRDADLARAGLAGLWLRFDFLDQAHKLSQAIDSPTGSFWHGIVHRREGDYGNARYWFHRVGAHPVLPELAAAAQDHGWQGKAPFTPFALITLVQTTRRAGSRTGDEAFCLALQQREWELLFDFCWRGALGRPALS